ncbi:MAG: hypothetical protein J1D77_06445 [Muribaculaceae bacterium]|nr:hypothetical protein [Muribaculaceae bacterium]
MKRAIIYIYLTLQAVLQGVACTSAIIGADMNPYGRPLLWKNRDTSAFDNKIEYVEGKNGEFSFVGLYNAKDSLLQEVWMGMNDHGFAVMNTASYNIKDDDVPQKEMDKEGLVMSRALRVCRTVDDFANLLDTLPRPMGVEANFGAIDAYGNGAYFETNNHSFTRFNIEDAPNHVLVRTNYSHSGRDNEGFGFIREANAETLLEPYIAEKNVSPEVLTEVLSRSFFHSLLGKDFSRNEGRWVVDQDFIPRYTSTATVVVEGCPPLSPEETLNPEYLKEQYIMWTGLGYPPCAEIYPVWCSPEGVDPVLEGDPSTGRSPQCDTVLERKAEVFPFTKGNGNKYIDMNRLFNEEGTGYVEQLVPKNLATYQRVRKEREGRD